MITIVDYGLGNVGAFANMFKRLNIAASVARLPGDLESSTHIILPGVGAFDHAIELLNASGMRDALDDLVRSGDVHVLGVCVGMQILAESSEEGEAEGLGWVPGRVHAFAGQPGVSRLPLPHMGWNDVKLLRATPLLRGMEEDARFYFLHSFYFECFDPVDAVASAEYGIEFTCAVQRARVYGVQFHPEKSHHWGANLLRNFARA